MTDIQQVTITWSGVAGLNGFSNFYFLGGTAVQPPVAALKVFFEAIKANFPAPMKFSFPTAGNVINDQTGSLIGGWTATSNADTAATGPSNFNSGQGAIVEWKTTQVIDSHRPTGKTFLVPWITGSVGGGVISSSAQTTLQTAANALISSTASFFVIWHRPRRDKLPPHAINRVGGNVLVQSATVPLKMAVLTSRRD